MRKPNIVALPTSQMQAYCDVLGLGREVQQDLGTMIEALQAASFAKLKKGVTHNFDSEKVAPGIIASRKAKFGFA